MLAKENKCFLSFHLRTEIHHQLGRPSFYQTQHQLIAISSFYTFFSPLFLLFKKIDIYFIKDLHLHPIFFEVEYIYKRFFSLSKIHWPPGNFNQSLYSQESQALFFFF